jgi:hypothetical protein
MRTTDLFNFNRSSKRLNESLHKTFGTRINFESFDTPKLEDARNKLRTQIHTARNASGFNETVENEALTKAQFMHDAIVAELMDREEHIVDTTVEEAPEDRTSYQVARILADNGMSYDSENEDEIIDAIGMILSGRNLFDSGYNKGISDAAKIVYDCPEAQMIAIKGKDLGSILTEQIEGLEIK